MAASNPVFIDYLGVFQQDFNGIYDGIEDPGSNLPQIMVEASRTGARQTTDPLDSLKFQGRSELGRNFGRMGVPAENSWIHAFLTCTSQRFLLFYEEAKVEIVKKFRTVLRRNMKSPPDVSIAQFIVNTLLPDTVKSVFPELDTLEQTINGEDEFGIGHGFAIAWFFGLNLIVLEEKDGSYEINCNTSYQSPSCPVIFMIHKNGRYEPVFQLFDSLADERNKSVFQWWDQALCTLKELSEKTCKKDGAFDQTWFLPQCEGEEGAAAGNGAGSPGAGNGAGNGAGSLSLRGPNQPRKPNRVNEPNSPGSEPNGEGEAENEELEEANVVNGNNNSSSVGTIDSLNLDLDFEPEPMTPTDETALGAYLGPPPKSGFKLNISLYKKYRAQLEKENAERKRKDLEALWQKFLKSQPKKVLLLTNKEAEKENLPPLEHMAPKLNRQANTNEPVQPASGANVVLSSGEINPQQRNNVTKLRIKQPKQTVENRAAEQEERWAAQRGTLGKSTTTTASGNEIPRGQFAPGRASAAGVRGSDPLRGKKNTSAAAAARKTRRNRRQTR